MILINKDLEQNSIVLSSIPLGVTELHIHSDFTNKDFIITLDNNISLSNRYAEFVIEDYSSLSIGLFQYRLLVDTIEVEQGMLKVISNEPVTDSYLSFNPLDDDLKVFNG
ncbi:hypothetical protein [Pedobacter steynii]